MYLFFKGALNLILELQGGLALGTLLATSPSNCLSNNATELTYDRVTEQFVHSSTMRKTGGLRLSTLQGTGFFTNTGGIKSVMKGTPPCRTNRWSKFSIISIRHFPTYESYMGQIFAFCPLS